MDNDSNHFELRPPRATSHGLLLLIITAFGVGFIVLIRPVWLPLWLNDALPRLPAIETPNAGAGPRGATPAPAPAPNSLPPRPVASIARRMEPEVYRCIRGSSVTYSTDAACAGGKVAPVSIDRSANIVESTPVPVQPVANLALNQPAAGFSGPANIGPRPRADTPECRWLDQAVLQLDDAGRHPQSALAQQGIREERQRARNRQFAIGC